MNRIRSPMRFITSRPSALVEDASDRKDIAIAVTETAGRQDRADGLDRQRLNLIVDCSPERKYHPTALAEAGVECAGHSPG